MDEWMRMENAKGEHKHVCSRCGETWVHVQIRPSREDYGSTVLMDAFDEEYRRRHACSKCGFDERQKTPFTQAEMDSCVAQMRGTTYADEIARREHVDFHARESGRVDPVNTRAGLGGVIMLLDAGPRDAAPPGLGLFMTLLDMGHVDVAIAFAEMVASLPPPPPLNESIARLKHLMDEGQLAIPAPDLDDLMIDDYAHMRLRRREPEYLKMQDPEPVLKLAEVRPVLGSKAGKIQAPTELRAEAPWKRSRRSDLERGRPRRR